MPAGTPSTIGPYEIRGELGRGGMGVVWRAYRPDLKTEYALKVILPGQDAEPEAVERFRREAQASAQLASHPGIIGCHDIGEDAGRVYFAMDLVEGRSLEELIDGGDLTPQESAAIVEQAARAVAHAHARSILHRDLKPANLLVTPGGDVRVGDFGLASVRPADAQSERLTQSGVVLGTAAYMPPEQARGQSLDARADVYALGATLYECLVGQPPFTGDGVYDVLDKLLRMEPRRPSKRDPRVPRDLETITLKCLEKDPDRRYPTADALAADLARWRAGEAIGARPPGGLERGWKQVRRHKVAVTAAGLGLVVAGSVAAAVLVPRWRAAQRREAEADARAEAARRTEAAQAAQLRRTAAARPHLDAGRALNAKLDRVITVQGHRGGQSHELAASARAAFDRALELDPGNADVMLAISRTYQLLEDWPNARDWCDGAIAADAHFARARLDRAMMNLEVYEALRHKAGEGTSLDETPEGAALRAAIEADLAAVRNGSDDAQHLARAQAMLDFADGKFAAAGRGLEAYARYAVADARAWFWAGHAWFHVPGAHEAAIRCLDEGLRYRPRTVNGLSMRGSMLANAARLDEALADLQRALELDPQSSTAFHQRANVHLRLGKFVEAERDFTAALTLEPGNAITLASRSGARRERGDFAGALQDSEAAVAAAPAWAPAWGHLASSRRSLAQDLARRGERAASAAQLRAASEAISKAIALAPDSTDNFNIRCLIRLDGGDAAGAEADATRAIACDAGNIKAWCNRGLIRMRRGALTEADADYTEAIRRWPTWAPAYFNRGLVRDRQQRHAEAITDFTAAIELRPLHAGSWMGRATAHHMLKQYGAAERDYTEAIRLSPRDPLIYFNRAISREGQGRIGDALADAETCLRLAPAHWPYRRRVQQYRDRLAGR